MALIRQADAVRLSEQAISLDLGDLAAHAEAILARARGQAQQVIDAAKDERKRIVAGAEHAGLQHGHQKGFEQGLKQGVEKGQKQALDEYRERLKTLEHAWSTQLTGFASAREELVLQAGEQVVSLALLIAQRIVRHAIAANPQLVVEQAIEMVRMATGASRLVLRVHPQDELLLREAMPQVLEAAGVSQESQHIRLVTSADLSRGSLVLDVAGGAQIEASIEGQLQRLTALLLGESASKITQEKQAGNAREAAP
jgi:flagellar assembly protein FliH